MSGSSGQQNVTPLWGRPPTGVWPPCPPGPGMSGLFRLEECWRDVKAAKEALKRIIADIIAEDPTIVAGVGVAGVTDGSWAQPGQVGEVVQFITPVSYGEGTQTQNVSAGILPPGDWDLYASAGFSTVLLGAQFVLNPVPAGFDFALNAASQASLNEGIVLVSQLGLAHTSAPSLLAYAVTTNVAAGTGAGTMTLFTVGRRRR